MNALHHMPGVPARSPPQSAQKACAELVLARSHREQLKRSTALRVRGQRALDELKAEFEAITKDLVSDAVATLTVPSLASPGGEHSAALCPDRIGGGTPSLPEVHVQRAGWLCMLWLLIYTMRACRMHLWTGPAVDPR